MDQHDNLFVGGEWVAPLSDLSPAAAAGIAQELLGFPVHHIEA